MRFARLAVIAAGIALAPGAGVAETVDAGDGRYLLGPQDRVMVRVHSLRRNTGEVYAWTPLTGEFLVEADGMVSIPIVGRLPAAGKTTSELASSISGSLKQAANLAESPSAAVEVTRYRPFFIMGAVQQPGKYEFQPGMTVLQAVSVANGFERSTDIAGVERETITTQGELRQLDGELIKLEAQMARLEAEAAETETTISFPEELTERGDDPRVETAMREETLRFTASRNALAAELREIEQSKQLLTQELKSLDEKALSLDRQLELFTQDLAVTTDLRGRGLAVSSRQIAAENSQLNIRSSMLDAQLAKLRAQQSLARARRDTVDVAARYRKQALDSLVETRTQLERSKERRTTVNRLYETAMTRMMEATGDTKLVPAYTITRLTTSGAVSSDVGTDAILQAGDVLHVSLRQAPVRSSRILGQQAGSIDR
ncbi:MAG: polysaccharide biosynthesis/export family protein [Pseudochelatococcus sp.]|jgi:exopolysaccharide production protein ExoF|uniref:polysaccharide biosynthesis/export family protein n=1 Tax=Pseudochelatococcus sp. TaxID=2020869 RepID=UPI003D91EC05